MASLLRRLARPAVLIPVSIPVGLYAFAKLNPEKTKAFNKRAFAWGMSRTKAWGEKGLGPLKQDIFSGLKEQDTVGPLQVLEIGAGGGANFKYFPPGTSVIAVDPNPHFDQYLKESSGEYPHVKVTKFVVAGAENMADVAEGSVDAVVCTLVLCSVQNIDAVLGEVKRVLKPGGKFYYLEHVRHPTLERAQYLQELLNPVFNALADGCNLNRETWKHVDSAGFSDVKYKIHGDIRPKFLTQILYGTATK